MCTRQVEVDQDDEGQALRQALRAVPATPDSGTSKAGRHAAGGEAFRILHSRRRSLGATKANAKK